MAQGARTSMLVSPCQLAHIFSASTYDLRHVGFVVSDHPLAQGFDLIDGEVSFGVPSNIEPGTNYIIARECLPFLSQYDDVYSPPQSSATLGISAHNLLLHLRQIEKKIRYSTIYTSHNTF
jgi:hypothetical protein